METVNYYVPSQFHRFLDINTGLYHMEGRIRFQIIFENDYYLQMIDEGCKTLIPEPVIKKIIQDVTNHPKTALFQINKNLEPLKAELLRQYVAGTSLVDIASFLEQAKGYAVRDQNMLFFFDSGNLKINMLERRSDTSFSLFGHIYKMAEDNNIFKDTVTFVIYHDEHHILRCHTAYNDGIFVIESITVSSDMDFKIMYQENKTIADIYTMYSYRKKNLFSKILFR